MVKVLSGGGYNSRNVSHVREGKVEPVSHKGNPAGVAQQGMATAFKKEPITEGRGYEPGKMAPTGSRGTYNAATSGPGSQRTTYKAGTQQANPVAHDLPKGPRTF